MERVNNNWRKYTALLSPMKVEEGLSADKPKVILKNGALFIRVRANATYFRIYGGVWHLYRQTPTGWKSTPLSVAIWAEQNRDLIIKLVNPFEPLEWNPPYTFVKVEGATFKAWGGEITLNRHYFR